MPCSKIIADSSSLPLLRTFARIKRAKGIYHGYSPPFSPVGACAFEHLFAYRGRFFLILPVWLSLFSCEGSMLADIERFAQASSQEN